MAAAYTFFVFHAHVRVIFIRLGVPPSAPHSLVGGGVQDGDAVAEDDEGEEGAGSLGRDDLRLVDGSEGAVADLAGLDL